uniref:Uncharacterized protein n=1 Tax=Anguilla anguilla TaxID=7936 RepID=A0A0E9TNR1_ANGAN
MPPRMVVLFVKCFYGMVCTKMTTITSLKCF